MGYINFTHNLHFDVIIQYRFNKYWEWGSNQTENNMNLTEFITIKFWPKADQIRYYFLVIGQTASFLYVRSVTNSPIILFQVQTDIQSVPLKDIHNCQWPY